MVEKLSDVNYSIKITDDTIASPFVIHINRLRLAPNRRPHLVLQPSNDSLLQNRYNLRHRTSN